MNHLRQSELRLLLAFVDDCYKPRAFEDFAQHLVDVLPKLISADHVTYNEMDPHKGKSHNYVNTAELATPTAGHLWEQHMHDHPVLKYIVETGDCRAVRISDFFTQRQLRARGLYSDFYRDLGIEDALCFNLSYQPPLVVGIGLHRRRRFSDRERMLADAVQPHIVQAWRNAKLVSRTQCQLQLANEVMDSRGSGVIVCTAEFQVQYISPLARRYVTEYLGVSQGLDHALPDELLRWVTHQIAQSFTDDVPAARLPLRLQKGNKRLFVRLLSKPEANLLLLEEEITSPDVSALERLGLTPRETEVLSWVAQGKTNSDIGSILGVNPRTVKKHLEHIFQKLGVETRTAAAAVAFEFGSTKNSA
jgi:DNA-binding CsgD family transcriptional regulator